MEEREKLIKLYDIYKNLLTEKQKECFEYYYFEDLSLSEISENLNVSKSFIGKTLSKIELKLNQYEETLLIYETNIKIEKIKETTTDKKTKEELENLLK